MMMLLNALLLGRRLANDSSVERLQQLYAALLDEILCLPPEAAAEDVDDGSNRCHHRHDHDHDQAQECTNSQRVPPHAATTISRIHINHSKSKTDDADDNSKTMGQVRSTTEEPNGDDHDETALFGDVANSPTTIHSELQHHHHPWVQPPARPLSSSSSSSSSSCCEESSTSPMSIVPTHLIWFRHRHRSAPSDPDVTTAKNSRNTMFSLWNRQQGSHTAARGGGTRHRQSPASLPSSPTNQTRERQQREATLCMAYRILSATRQCYNSPPAETCPETETPTMHDHDRTPKQGRTSLDRVDDSNNNESATTHLDDCCRLGLMDHRRLDDDCWATRSDQSATTMQRAQAVEATVVLTIRKMGEVLVRANHRGRSGGVVVDVTRSKNHGNNNKDFSSPQEFSSTQQQQQQLCHDEVFEYFCEKAILSLLVDIVKQKPGDNAFWISSSRTNIHFDPTTSSAAKRPLSLLFSGVVWSPAVKAQVLHTVALLVATVREPSALFYLLSQNAMNQLIQTMLPLQQWTDAAIHVMLRPYLDLLRNLTLHLGPSPYLFAFLSVEPQNNHNGGSPSSSAFPLYTALLEIITTHGSSDSYVHATCFGLLVNLMHIRYPPVQDWFRHGALREQRLLPHHLGHRLCQCYIRLSNLTTGLVVDAVRSDAISGQCTVVLRNLFQEVNDIFASPIPVAWHVRLCEALLQQFVAPLLQNLLPRNHYQHHHQHHSPSLVMIVGESDADVIPQDQARAQVAVVVLYQMLSQIHYAPLLRMIAIALLHPKSMDIWSRLSAVVVYSAAATNTAAAESATTTNTSGGTAMTSDTVHEYEYIVMPALNNLVTGWLNDPTITTIQIEQFPGTSSSLSFAVMDNPYRTQLLLALQGYYGEWRVVVAACLWEQILQSNALGDTDMLCESLQLFPTIATVQEEHHHHHHKQTESMSSAVHNNEESNTSSTRTTAASTSTSSSSSLSLEQALVHFLSRSHERKSAVSFLALECVSSLALNYLAKLAAIQEQQQQQQQQANDTTTRNNSRIPWHVKISPVETAFFACRDYFYRCILESQSIFGVSSLFVDLIESTVLNLYRRTLVIAPATGSVHGASAAAPPSRPRAGGAGRPRIFAYHLHQHSCAVIGNRPDVLIRKFRDPNVNEVEAARFFAHMALHYRAVGRVWVRYRQKQQQQHREYVNVMRSQQSPKTSSYTTGEYHVEHHFELDWLDRADELSHMFGRMRDRSLIGSLMDLRGRMCFRFTSVHEQIGSPMAGCGSSSSPMRRHRHVSYKNSNNEQQQQRDRSFSEDMIFRPSQSSHFSLVLDPSDLYIVKERREGNHGTIVCNIPLLGVLCAACDGEWLHIAIQDYDDDDRTTAYHNNLDQFMKNGNMPLRFESMGTCLIVQQYLDRCRQLLRQELLEKIQLLFHVDPVDAGKPRSAAKTMDF